MNTFQSTRFRKKVVLYPTWGDRLLVFFEPDFPDVAKAIFPKAGKPSKRHPTEAAHRSVSAFSGYRFARDH
jgi:hypothetical protein